MKSLRAQSVLATLIVLVPIFIGMTWLLYSVVDKGVNERFDSRIVTEVDILGTLIERRNLLHAHDGAMQISELMALDTVPSRKSFGVWVNGELKLFDKDFPGAHVKPSLGFTSLQLPNSRWRTYAETRHLAATGENLVVMIAEPQPSRTETIELTFSATAWPLAVVLPLIVLGVYFALRRSLAPIALLTNQIRQRSAKQLEPIATDSLPSEMQPIAESVNQLMARIGESFEREKQFTADAAHELRTPLTALKTHAQVALHTDDDNQRRVTLHKIVGTVNRTSRLISQLLTLARLDPQAPHTYVDTVNLDSVVRQTVAELALFAESRGQQLQFNTEPQMEVRGSRDALSILTRNVVENAIQYTPNGQPIDVRIYRDGEHAVLEVSDTGPGIPDAAKSDVFKRFFRMPDSRVFGTGLGLAIVQRIVELHGGHIGLLNRDTGTGLVVRATFPLSS